MKRKRKRKPIDKKEGGIEKAIRLLTLDPNLPGLYVDKIYYPRSYFMAMKKINFTR